jgi:iron complex transport system substrate-binding protein
MKVKKFLATFLAALLLMASVGCAQAQSSNTATINEPVTPLTSPEAEPRAPYEFTDDAGRSVELPGDLTRIAPSGPLAQLVLYTLCPDKMVGWGTEVTEAQRQYIDDKYADLPVFGNFYGDTLNLEAVMAADTEVIIDIGEAKQTIKEDMEGVQEKTGLPTIFVRMELDNMADAYRTLGEIVGETERAEELAAYIEATLADTKKKVDAIPAAERAKVYYGQDKGTTAVIAGTVHGDVIEMAGGVNVAEVEETLRGGAADVSMEQLMLWNPDVVLLAPESIYDTIATSPEWAEITAIKTQSVYEIPADPYNWMGRPPSVNRIIGVKWLSNLLYPEVFGYDMVKETQNFYKLFYHCDLSADQAKTLMSKSTFK